MHIKRIITALIAVPLLYLYITELPVIWFALFLALAGGLAQYEFYAMYKTSRTLSVIGILSGIALTAAYSLCQGTAWNPAALVLICSFLLITTIRLFSPKNPEKALADIAPALAGILYVPLLLMPLWYLRQSGYEWIFLMLLCVWSADTFAYYTGRSIGRHKLYIEISPNKTVEGGIGSVAGATAASCIYGTFFMKGLALPQLVLIGAVLGTVTIIGDLVESMLKRDAGIKDSGSLIPGHGGVLDRIDSLLFAGPVLYMIKLLI